MNLKEIANLRLINQHIDGTKLKTPKEIVSWMGAMQAQDFAMAKWAIGVRLPGSTEKEIESAFNAGKILRTHLLRPTWHFVSAEDIYWILELTAPHIRASSRSRWKELEIDENICKKCSRIIAKILADNNHMTREEIFEKFEAAKIGTANQRGVHLLMEAELNGLICSGRLKGNRRTYALLEERVPKPKGINREEALEKIAVKYFLSHGPAALQDFVWWSGLPVKNARQAVEMVKQDFVSETIASRLYWFTNSISIPSKFSSSSYLLPAYDEYLISYKDRSSALEFRDHEKTVSSNGIFRPSIIIDGRVAGIWKKTVKGGKIIVEVKFFHNPGKSVLRSLKTKSAEFGKFSEMDTQFLIG